jgi:hypothetical protein
MRLVPAAAGGYIAWALLSHDTEHLPPRTGQLDEQYFPAVREDAPLLVLFGGAQGGDVWAGLAPGPRARTTL